MSAQACGYLVSRYPSVTHTFVLTEIEALREAGVRVETASVRRVPPDQVLSPRDRREHDATYALLPPGVLRLVAAHGAALLRAPRAYLTTAAWALRHARPGGRARVWQLFYFGEAMLLWRWMRRKRLHHVRVHHANVSADVALLACRYANAAGATPRWTWSMTLHGPTEMADVAGHKLALKVGEASLVACTSDWSRSQVLAIAEPGALAHVRTIRCGIDVEMFAPVTRAAGEHEPEVLCVAALSRRKGHAVLLEAFARLRRDGVRARLTLVGDGAERARLEAQATRLGLADVVEFAGPVGQDQIVERFYSRADVFCLPSFAEGLPTVLMEAMAAALPVVGTNVMGTAELVRDGVTGLLVAPARADALADALGALLADPQRARELGAGGRARVCADYELHAAAAHLRAALAPLIVDQ